VTCKSCERTLFTSEHEGGECRVCFAKDVNWTMHLLLQGAIVPRWRNLEIFKKNGIRPPLGTA
jgi:hypothetical protein